MPLVEGLCHTADFDQMWSKYLPLVGGHCHTADFNQMWSRIYHTAGYRPSVVKKTCPSSEDFVTQRTSTECGPNIFPSSEDFVSQRTVTKCGREFFSTWRTGHAVGPDQMWSIKCRRSKESSSRAKSRCKEKDIQRSDSDQGCQQAPKIRSDCVNQA